MRAWRSSLVRSDHFRYLDQGGGWAMKSYGLSHLFFGTESPDDLGSRWACLRHETRSKYVVLENSEVWWPNSTFWVFFGEFIWLLGIKMICDLSIAGDGISIFGGKFMVSVLSWCLRSSSWYFDGRNGTPGTCQSVFTGKTRCWSVLSPFSAKDTFWGFWDDFRFGNAWLSLISPLQVMRMHSQICRALKSRFCTQ